MSKKLLVIVGVTGNQGRSVAERFLQDPNYHIRGLTRNTSSPAAQELAAKGVELVAADLNDPSTLTSVFTGANLVFSVTNYWEPFFRPDCIQQAAEQGISRAKFSYDVEYRHGINIVDAVAKTVDTLDDNGLIASTLSAAKKCSNGRLTEVYHFDAKSDVFPDYVNEKYPQLAKKMSCMQTGCFMTSYRLEPSTFFAKQPDGSFESRFPMSPTKLLPHLDVNTDTGPFVYAISKMPPGKSYLAAGTICPWPEYDRTWAKVTGVKCSYQQVSKQQMIDAFDDKDAGVEIADQFAYCNDPGLDGGEKLLTADDLREAGIECKMTTLEEFMRQQDWSDILNR